jgi:flagellar hook assembly protein FlgD
VLLDSDGLMNYLPSGTQAGADDSAARLRPFLYPSRPNPSNGTTTFAFSIPQKAKVSLKLYDVQGRLIRTLVDGMQPAGIHPIVWDGRSDAGYPTSSGVYFYRLKTPGYERTRKAVLLK